MKAAAGFTAPMSFGEVVRRTAAEVNDDNCLGIAAQLSFYFFLALFPALLFLVALLGYVPIDRALSTLLDALGPVAPEEMIALLRGQIDELRGGSDLSLLTFGIIGAVWSSSAATVAIIDAMNRAYDVTEWRPWWKRRLVAVGLTIGLALFIVAALAFVMIGPEVAGWAARNVGLAPAVAWVWIVIRWPLIILLVMLGIDLVYHFAPNLKHTWAWITPGSVLATVLWIASSLAFKFYVSRFADFNATHGAIGGVIVVMLWFYVSSFAILIGAELNSVIEQARHQTRPVTT
jgi:membrane protein